MSCVRACIYVNVYRSIGIFPKKKFFFNECRSVCQMFALQNTFCVCSDLTMARLVQWIESGSDPHDEKSSVAFY